ncbi:MAG: hypothetical protein JWM93_933 [Frankiales bacterium]|nr:hypothetical protein [Frankiales bacterium]
MAGRRRQRDPSNAPPVLSLLAPSARWCADGVARVTVRLRHGRSVTVPVRDNVYRYTIHDSPASMGTIWLDAAGRRIDHRKRP